MSERQHRKRMRAILGARIIFNNKSSTIDCQIRNISSAGAKLVLSETVALPSEFDLHIPQKGRTFRACLRWRSVDSVGVEFLSDKAHKAQVDDVITRIRELETENELLRERARELMVEREKSAHDPPSRVESPQTH